MDNAKALFTLSALANGVHPDTGEVFAADSPYQTADVVRALYVGVRASKRWRRRISGPRCLRMQVSLGPTMRIDNCGLGKLAAVARIDIVLRAYAGFAVRLNCVVDVLKGISWNSEQPAISTCAEI